MHLWVRDLLRGNPAGLSSMKQHRAEAEANSLVEMLRGPLPSSQCEKGRESKWDWLGGGNNEEFVCMEATLAKMEHMCMCERTRWESM